jgi:hypothetical protein
MSARSSGPTSAARRSASSAGTAWPPARNSVQLVSPVSSFSVGSREFFDRPVRAVPARRPRQHGRIVVAEEARYRQQQAGARLGEDIGGLGSLEAGIQRHKHAAGPLQAKRGDQPASRVRPPDGDAVALAQARRQEGPGGAGDLGVQLLVREAQVPVDNGLGRGDAVRGHRQQTAGRSPGQVAARVVWMRRLRRGLVARRHHASIAAVSVSLAPSGSTDLKYIC